jgi:hypothetical protein
MVDDSSTILGAQPGRAIRPFSVIRSGTVRRVSARAWRGQAFDRERDAVVTYSIVIPVHNEEEPFQALVQRLRGIMDRLDGPAEVVEARRA